MAEALVDDAQGLESTTVSIRRTATTVKGGRRMSFAALVVVGDRRGSVGLGYGKAPGVPAAIEKAQKDARKKLARVPLLEGTVPHSVNARFSASRVRLVPAAPGTGVIAGGTVRAVLELAGVRDCLTKSVGSSNQINLAKAVIEGLKSMVPKAEIEKRRGVELEQTEVEAKVEAGQKHHAVTTAAPPTPLPTPAKTEEPKQAEQPAEAAPEAQAQPEQAAEASSAEQPPEQAPEQSAEQPAEQSPEQAAPEQAADAEPEKNE